MEYLETERMILRSWERKDLSLFAAMNKDERIMRYFPSTMTDEQSEAFFNRIRDEFDRNGWGLFAVELKSTGCFIGYVGLHEIGFDADFTPGVEIGWRLAAECHGQGLATEAAATVLKFAEAKGLPILYSFTAKPNIPSERVMQKIGMKRVGEFDHPSLPPDSPLRRHILYRIEFDKR